MSNDDMLRQLLQDYILLTATPEALADVAAIAFCQVTGVQQQAQQPPTELLEAVCRELDAAESIMRRAVNWTSNKAARADIQKHYRRCAVYRGRLERFADPVCGVYTRSHDD